MNTLDTIEMQYVYNIYYNTGNMHIYNIHKHINILIEICILEYIDIP